jgi:UDP-N-acetylglucosamine 2-epimerase (non-hydrolysing)
MKEKILTILGTRPEIIRLSVILNKLENHYENITVFTGQNYDKNLNDIFWEQLRLKKPKYILDSKSSTTAQQLSKIFIGIEEILFKEKPKKVLILGDTYSCLSSIICERYDVPVYHMEAGNRCFDLKVPEEKNRKIIDSVSSYNLPYTNISKNNLLKEGFPEERIFVTGNPIKEIIQFYEKDIEDSDILEKLNLQKNKYIISTAHRAENVDVEERLKSIFKSFEIISKEYKIVFSCHPRTREKIKQFNIDINDENIIILEPMGFFDFIKLEKNSFMAISDSGTVQEEMCIFGIPTVTIRDTTERPETVDCGSNIISGLDTENIIKTYNIMKNVSRGWKIPPEYDRTNVSDLVIDILKGTI